jgi:hypothetical protein
VKPIDPRAVPAPVAFPLRSIRRVVLELVLLTMIAVLAPARSWEVLANFMRQHTLIRAEIIAVGLTAVALWLRRVDIRGLRNRIGAAADHRLTGTPATAPAPASGYTHYLPCALYVAPSNLRRRNRGEFGLAPGVLYTGPAGVRFEPRRIDHAGRESAIPPFAIGPVREVTATAVRATRCIADAIAGRHLALHLRWGGKTALFRVPGLSDALPRLHARLEELKYGPLNHQA